MTSDQGGSGQSQIQSQEQSFTVNVQSSGDPELERRIFNKVHSAGRQLGRIADVVEALIEASPALADDAKAKPAIDAFRQMRADIEREKQGADPRYFIQRLETLRHQDPAAFTAVAAELRTWLNTLPATPQTEPARVIDTRR